jgi:transposase
MTGEVHEAHLFVAVLGASSCTYAEARWSETLPDWIGAHVNTLDFLGGVPRAAVPDNLALSSATCLCAAGRLYLTENPYFTGITLHTDLITCGPQYVSSGALY